MSATKDWRALGRRAFCIAAASAMATVGHARTSAPLRLAAIDWAMAETAMMLGYPPLAIAELRGLRRVEAMPIPADIVDLGLRGAPNMEALSLVGPDLILSSSYYQGYQDQLERIAPVLSPALFVPGEEPLPKVIALLDQLAARIGHPQAAQNARRAMSNEVAQLTTRLAPMAGEACLLIELGDSRHIRVFGTDSLFGGMIEMLGLRNAWTRGTRFAFSAPVPMETLIDHPQVHIIITGDVPIHVDHGLRRSALWNALPAVRAGRVVRLGDMNGFGGVPSALRFARDLTRALEARA